MNTVKQVSVSLENKPGRLANVLSALAHEKINVDGLAVMDSYEYSVLRMVTSDAARTLQLLKEKLGVPCSESEVVMVELRNQPGELAHICAQLAAEHINIDYCYVSAAGRNGKTMGIFKVSNTEKALRIVSQPTNNKTRRQMGRRPIHTMKK